MLSGTRNQEHSLSDQVVKMVVPLEDNLEKELPEQIRMIRHFAKKRGVPR